MVQPASSKSSAPATPNSLDARPLLQPQFDRHRICVIIPTYNNSTTLLAVVESTLRYTANLIIVNDGSTDGTAQLLAGLPQVQQVSYPRNVGKGWALRQGFAAARQQGYDYAISLDSDGQHFPSDLPAFVNQLEAGGPALIIGARNMGQAGIPSKSSFGHRFSNFWFWVETGLRAPDTQSGYRLYPLQPLAGQRFFTRKYEFEIEVLVRAAWQGVTVAAVPIAVYYAPGKERITHFRPFTDFSRISVLNTVLVVITLLYIKPRDLVRALLRPATYRRLWAQLTAADESNLRKALSIALGLFMGIAPLWGFQLVLAIALAVVLKLNRYLVILSANISLPPMIPLIIYASYLLGGCLVENPTPIAFNQNLTLAAIHQNFVQYCVGSVALALAAALLGGLVTYLSLLLFRRNPAHQDG